MQTHCTDGAPWAPFSVVGREPLTIPPGPGAPEHAERRRGV